MPVTSVNQPDKTQSHFATYWVDETKTPAQQGVEGSFWLIVSKALEMLFCQKLEGAEKWIPLQSKMQRRPSPWSTQALKGAESESQGSNIQVPSPSNCEWVNSQDSRLDHL